MYVYHESAIIDLVRLEEPAFFRYVTCSDYEFKCNYPKSKKLFLNFLLHFWNLYQTLNIFKYKMTLIAYVLPKLQNANDLVRPMSKNPRFRTPFEIQHFKGSQSLVKSAWQHFHQISSSLWTKLTGKMSLS